MRWFFRSGRTTPAGSRLGFAHRRIECVRGAFTNDWDDDRSDSRRVTFCGLSDIHTPRLKIRALCPQWVLRGLFLDSGRAASA
jgi:hypothetical protein